MDWVTRMDRGESQVTTCSYDSNDDQAATACNRKINSARSDAVDGMRTDKTARDVRCSHRVTHYEKGQRTLQTLICRGSRR
jgi:hypothetical protein